MDYNILVLFNKIKKIISRFIFWVNNIISLLINIKVFVSICKSSLKICYTKRVNFFEENNCLHIAIASKIIIFVVQSMKS